MRAAGIIFSACSNTCASIAISVSIKPGATQLTVILRFASSIANAMAGMTPPPPPTAKEQPLMTRCFATDAALCLSLAVPAQAGGDLIGPAPTPPSAAEMAFYAAPAQRVDVGGRSINLYCIGDGARTLLFEAGGSDWSIIWALVQPRMGDGYRACAYDRAGMGFSDPSPWPRTPIAIVEDMHAMVTAAALPKPLILIGHSLGGFNAKLYAALYPEDVAALILVDPSEENADARGGAYLRQILGDRAAARSELMDASFLNWLMDRYRQCAGAAAAGPMEAHSHRSPPLAAAARSGRPALGQRHWVRSCARRSPRPSARRRPRTDGLR